MGVSIQQAPLIEQVSGVEKIPISDDSGLPKAVTTEQLKTYINVPSKTSELTNDSGFLTEHLDISHLATQSLLSSINTELLELGSDVNMLNGATWTRYDGEDFWYFNQCAIGDDGLLIQYANFRTSHFIDISNAMYIKGHIFAWTSSQSAYAFYDKNFTLIGERVMGQVLDFFIGKENIPTSAVYMKISTSGYEGAFVDVLHDVSKKIENNTGLVEKLESYIKKINIEDDGENLVSQQKIHKVIGNGLSNVRNKNGVYIKLQKISGRGYTDGEYSYINFELNDGVHWIKNHEYYCAIDVLVRADSRGESTWFEILPKYNESHGVGSVDYKSLLNLGERSILKIKVKIDRGYISQYPTANILFVQFGGKMYPETIYDADIYNVVIVDLGIPGTVDYRDWDAVDSEFESIGITDQSVGLARKSLTAEKIEVKGIELWGDSLTAQNYGKHIRGANVYTYGFGGKTSTYIRDKFLSEADKNATQVIWVGRNNSQETDVVIDDIRDMVSALTHNNFIVMCPPNGYYGEFGTNGEDGTGEMKGGNGHSKFLELEKRLSEEYPSNFLNIRKAVIEGWRMGNIRLLSDFTQPSVGENVTIEVSDANFLTTYNSYDENKFGHEFVAKIRIGINGSYDVYKIVEKVDDTHLTVQLEEINRISSGNTVENIVDSGETNSVKYLRVMQNADYMCWLYDTTLSTFRKDGIHMTEDGLKLVALIVSRKLASMKLL